MKKHLKQYTLIGIIFVTIAGTLSHFVYEWSGKNPFLALFLFPINETTWEHMKLVFFPSIVYATFMAYKITFFISPYYLCTFCRYSLGYIFHACYFLYLYGNFRLPHLAF